ncbi:unnamed protein product [Fraxinus pennsylvanica]|uniref:Exportin-2 C-terminal domain-containing protein n=1 Tax=Fraxinus pennsylvanica TaxID=56036 RepID=A0AAD1ZLV5_9LAMI|nr:unnamed protein product [Fraxinus pennsylvanica]
MNTVQPDIFCTIFEQFWIPNLKLITEQERVEEEPDVPDLGESVGYNVAFVHLYNAGRKEKDTLPEINDPKQFLVLYQANLSARSPEMYPQVINEYLEPVNRAALLKLCSSCNVTIV